MADIDAEGGASREEIVQRIELMEAMVAEGRRFTARYGWIFVLWGVVDLAAMSWRYFQPDSLWVGQWAWPICLVAGAVLTLIGRALQGRQQSCIRGLRCRSVEAVWGMMGLALAIYITGAMVRHLNLAILVCSWASHHHWNGACHQRRDSALAHAGRGCGNLVGGRDRSVLRAVEWRVCERIMFLEMVFGMILFGVYAMVLERMGGGRANENG